MLLRRVLISILLILYVVDVNSAQLDAQNYFGDSEQSGFRLHENIMLLVDKDLIKQRAIIQGINEALTKQATTLPGEAKSAVAFDIPIANEFYDYMIDVNSLIDVIKSLIELHPEKVIHIITLGVVLYPDYAQSVFDGAALTGNLDPNDILIAVLQAGADPSSVSAATAAGASVTIPDAAIPLGAGIGAGGTGGGDTTASTN